MVTRRCHIQTLEELRDYVNQILCEQQQLQAGVFPITQRWLVRGSRPCGILFCLHGPRAVKFTAIWETDRNRILFYGSDGARLGNVQLAEAPALDAERSWN